MSSPRNGLPVIQVAQPCPASWETMKGDERVRFCEHCQRSVHHLSAMTASEVNDLICQKAGPLCVRFDRAADGSVITLDYQPRKDDRRRVTRRWLLAAALVSLAASVADVLWGRREPPPAKWTTLGSML